MAPQQPQPSGSRSESSQSPGTLSNVPPAETKQQRIHQVVHRNTANAASANITWDSQLQIILKTRSRRHKKQHEIEWEYIRIVAAGRHLTI